MPKVNWTDADIPNAFGYTATVGNRTVNLLRAQYAEYHVFGEVDGRTMKQIPDSKYLTLTDAKALGAKLLLSKEEPETWGQS